MIERHYDDEALAALLERDGGASDAHLPSCVVCREKLESFQMIADALADADVWDARPLHSEPVPETLATLRAFKQRMASEDAQAETFLRDLLDGPRESWPAKLAQHPEYRTAGVVRKLIAATVPALGTMPPDALAITALATDIADHLDAAEHPSDTITRLRGAAWREHAYALSYTGRFTEADKAICIADSHFSNCVVDGYERARLGIVRSLVERDFDRHASARAAATTSAERFTEFGDFRRAASARLAEVNLLYSRGEYREAIAILEPLEESMRFCDDADLHARILGNLGACWRQLGNLQAAIAAYEMSSSLFTELNVPTEAARNGWSVAGMLVTVGRIADARARLERVTADFERLGMTSEATLAGLDLAEILLANNEFAAVERICRNAIASFERAGVSYTARARTALVFMADAVQRRTASTKLVRRVREYITRLPAQPQLLFALPPD